MSGTISYITISSICGHVHIGLQGWTAKIHPLSFGLSQIPDQNSQTTSGHIWVLPILPFIPTQWTHSTDHLINLEFTNLALYPSITLNKVRIVDQGSALHSVSIPPIQLSSSNPFSLPDVMTFCSEMLWRDSWRSDFIMSISTGGVFVHTHTPVFGCSLIQIRFGGVFHSLCFSWQVGKGWVEFHTLTGHKTSGETTNTVILITDGVGKRELGLVTGFCHPNEAKWSPVIPVLPYTNATCQSLLWWVSEDILTLPTSLRGQFIYSIWMWTLYLGVQPQHNSHWTGCVCASYFLSAGLRYFYDTK